MDIRKIAPSVKVSQYGRRIEEPIPIVSDSLMFNLDAADASSYPGSGTTWYDLSGNNRNASLSSVTYSSDNSGILVFNGSSSMGTMSSIGSQSLYTVDAWFSPSINHTNNACVISDIYPSYVNFKIGFNASADIDGGVYIPGWYYTPRYTTSIGSWYHSVLTCTGANGSISLYINNSLVGSNSFSGTPQTTGTGIRIGRRWDNPDYFNGKISAIKFYNRVLSTQEISQNFNSLKDRFGV